MGITQKEIARALNLPLITVHRALNSAGYVSKELKGRILAYAYFWNDVRTGISIAAEQIQALNYRVNCHMVAERDSLARAGVPCNHLFFARMQE